MKGNHESRLSDAARQRQGIHPPSEWEAKFSGLAARLVPLRDFAADSLALGELANVIEQGLAESPLVLMSDAGKEISQLEIDKYRAATAATLDDFLARATRSRWAAPQILEELVRRG